MKTENIEKLYKQKKVFIQYRRKWDLSNSWICVLYARIVDSYFRDFHWNIPSGIMSFADFAKVSTTYLLASAIIRSQALQNEVQLQNQ